MITRGIDPRIGTVFTNFVRHYAYMKYRPKFWKEDAVQYGQVSYYPRHRDHVDPPITPTKLLMVKRIKKIKGNPYWIQTILRDQLGLEEKSSEPAIVKNTPEMCALLWKVKHLVKIIPIRLPDKLPTEDDMNATYLHENGTFYVTPKVSPARYEATESFVNDPKKLNRDIIQEKIRKQWLDGRIF